MMDDLPLNGPEVQRIGALRGDLISKHNCETHHPQDHSCFLSTERFGEGGCWLLAGHWRTNIHANNHKSQIEFLGHPAEVRGAVSPTLACRVSGLFPSVAKLRHPQQTPHHDLQNLLHLLLVVILSPLTSLSAIV